MPEQTSRILNHFTLYAFTEVYWSLSKAETLIGAVKRLRAMAGNIAETD